MKRFAVILLLHALLSTLLYSQDTFKLIGKIQDRDDSSLVENVHILNLSKRLGTTSNINGLFKITVSASDTLIFSVLGYEYQMHVVDDNLERTAFVPIELIPRVYELPDVYVWPYLTYAEFRQAFISFDVEEVKIDLKMLRQEAREAAAIANPSVSLGSPITALYNMFSKEGKELRKYQETVERDNYERYLASKFNEDIVSRITGLKTQDEIRKFMEYCNLSETFIAKSIEYDIYLAVLTCYNNYKKEFVD